MNHLFAEILHWMHQRGDTVGATRLLSSKKWGNLSKVEFERPAVFELGDEVRFFVGNRGLIADIGGVFYKLGHRTIKNPKFAGLRVRLYTLDSFTIQSDLKCFKTIGEMTDSDFLFNYSEFSKPLTLNTRNVVSMSDMFSLNESFNHPLYFDTRNVECTTSMFAHGIFDQDLNWDTRNLKYTDKMFAGGVFNKKLPWNTRNLQEMTGMFFDNKKFNQPLSWNTINLKCMNHAFRDAILFCQDLDWNLQNLENVYKASQPPGKNCGQGFKTIFNKYVEAFTNV